MNTIHACSPLQEETEEPASAPRYRDFPALRRSFRGGSRAKALADAQKRAPIDPRVVGEDEPFFHLERATQTFRYLQQCSYRRKAAAVRAELRRHRDVFTRAMMLVAGGAELVAPAVRQTMVDLEARAKWYEGRAGAQVPRFETVRACGSSMLHIACRVCREPATDAAVPCRCGVARVCDACAEHADERRQARFAAARESVLMLAAREGLDIKGRRGPTGELVGAFSEKMLTLTVPHFTREQCVEVYKKNGDRARDVLSETDGYGLDNTTAARVAALRLAWPKFWRVVKRHVAKRDPLGAKRLRYYRFWEWTRGTDGRGHPHFHVYLFAPWISAAMMRRAWVSALRAVGVVAFPQVCSQCGGGDSEACAFGRGRDHVIVDLRRLEGFNWNALRELIKQGDRRLVRERLGTLRSAPRAGQAVIEYAGGWSFADAFDGDDPGANIDVQRDLYIATENRRLCQGSRGFLLPVPVLVCECCGNSMWSAGVARPFDVCHSASEGEPREERGPPS